MKKKLTLEQAWKLCLQMWKWIAEQVEKNEGANVDGLKEQWMEKHPRFNSLKVQHNCFFCEYDSWYRNNCSRCPGRLVNKKFNCSSTSYHWSIKPVAFYHKIVELNEKQKAKKQG